MDGRSIGVDVYRDFCEVAVQPSAGEGRPLATVSARPQPLEEFAEQLCPTDRVALEATGNGAGDRTDHPPISCRGRDRQHRELTGDRELQAEDGPPRRQDARSAAGSRDAGALLAARRADAGDASESRASREARCRARPLQERGPGGRCIRNLKKPPTDERRRSEQPAANGSPVSCYRPTGGTPSTPRCGRSTSSPRRSTRSSTTSLSLSSTRPRPAGCSPSPASG